MEAAPINKMEELKQLMKKRDEMEAEVDKLTGYLTGPGMPGLVGGLVDKEGFPIEDVNLILSVREARHKLACKYLQSSLSLA